MILKAKNLMIFCGCLLLLVLLCLFPADAKNAVIEALQVCGCSVIPALFPFFVVSKLLISALREIPLPKFLCRTMERIFGVEGGCASPLLMSFLGGYPIGVSCIVSQYESGIITKDSAQRALRFSNNSGPGFFIGMVGAGALGSVRMGLILYLIHIFSALAVGRLFATECRSTVRIRRLPKPSASLSQQFIHSVSESCAALLTICGFILFFSLLLALMEAAGLFSFFPYGRGKEISAAIYGSLELTGGILSLKDCSAAFSMAAFFMGWGGLCVHFQAMSLWRNVGLQPKNYFLSKLLHGSISALTASCFITPNVPKLLFLGLIFVLCVFLPQIRKKSSGNSAQFAV